MKYIKGKEESLIYFFLKYFKNLSDINFDMHRTGENENKLTS